MKRVSMFIPSAAMALALIAGLSCVEAQAQKPTSSDPIFQKFLDLRGGSDKQAAIDYLEQAAAKGDSNAEAQLGEEYRGSDFELAGILKIDYKKSYEFTKAGVDQGNARAMTDMGSLYMKGQGVDKDYAQALKYFIKADEGGDRKAARYIAINYENGYGTKVDYKKAVEYDQKAADEGDTTGQCLLGSLYERGLGVDRSYDRATELYVKSAERGDIVASAGMAALGNLYETRVDGKQNLQTAIEWYRKAADQKNPEVKFDLERLTGASPRPIAAGRNLCLSPFRD